MGIPFQEDLKKAVSLNLIKNSNVICANIDLANEIYGIDIATMKGKIVRKNARKQFMKKLKYQKILSNAIKKSSLSVDTIYVNVMIFLTSISHNIFYRTAQYVPSKKTQHYKKCLSKLIQLYQNAEVQVTAIHCDNEFKTIFSQLSQKHQIKIYTVAAQSHVSKAERNNRVIKERIRCAYHNLDYKKRTKNSPYIYGTRVGK